MSVLGVVTMLNVILTVNILRTRLMRWFFHSWPFFGCHCHLFILVYWDFDWLRFYIEMIILKSLGLFFQLFFLELLFWMVFFRFEAVLTICFDSFELLFIRRLQIRRQRLSDITVPHLLWSFHWIIYLVFLNRLFSLLLLLHILWDWRLEISFFITLLEM